MQDEALRPGLSGGYVTICRAGMAASHTIVLILRAFESGRDIAKLGDKSETDAAPSVFDHKTAPILSGPFSVLGGILNDRSLKTRTWLLRHARHALPPHLVFPPVRRPCTKRDQRAQAGPADSGFVA